MAASITKWLVQFAIRHPGGRVEWVSLNDGEDGSDIRFPTPELAARAKTDLARRQPDLELRVVTTQVPA